MGLQQKIALALSTDLHAVAARLQEADIALQAAQGALAEMVAAAPPDLRTSGIYAALQDVGLDLADGRTQVVHAWSDLTGRGPEMLLREDPPNRG